MYLYAQTYLDYGVQQLTTIERPEITHDGTLQGMIPSWIVCLRLQTILFIKWRKGRDSNPQNALIRPTCFQDTPLVQSDPFH